MLFSIHAIIPPSIVLLKNGSYTIHSTRKFEEAANNILPRDAALSRKGDAVIQVVAGQHFPVADEKVVVLQPITLPVDKASP